MPAIWKNLVINFEQAEEFRDLKREVLDEGIYWFDTDQEEPVIIDVGAHIGLATLYFKWLYPGAEIWALEPNPQLFALLEQNVSENHLEKVHPLNVAVGRERGMVKFYRDGTDWQWWSVGSLLPGAWNGEQKVQEEIAVESIKLSDIVQNLSRVDLLKMDIEGVEQRVLLSLKEQLQKIQQIIFEFHPVRGQNLQELLAFLQKNGYQVRLKDRKNKTIKSWHEGELVLVEASRV
ncbi:FkbM family methyltransferase [bacterium]|nr:FkbM family methyltransferase [bacterium]